MKSLYLTESEKKHILNLHKSRMLLKEDPTTPAAGTTPAASTTTTPATGTPAAITNYTIQQLQTLLNSKGYNVGTADNQLGKNTLTQIEAAVKVAKGGTPAAPAAPAAPAPIPMDTKSVTSLQTSGEKVTGVKTATTGGQAGTAVASDGGAVEY